MAVRGRKPKPTALKEFEGNPGKRALNENEPKPELGAKCPSWLTKEAKKEWEKLEPFLVGIGLLTKADESTFANYCQAYADWVQAVKLKKKNAWVVETPNGALQTSPYVTIERQYSERLNKLAAEFGLTPSSRSRITAKMDNPESDEMELILKDL